MTEISIRPGEVYLAKSPMVLHTILGSCVSVTFWSARLGAGALCHGLLPRYPRKGRPQRARHLAEQFDGLGGSRQEIEIKIFGGADVLPVSSSALRKQTVGALNCESALEVVETEGFRIAATDLGGTRGRVIYFHTGTGEVLVHRLANLTNTGKAF